MPIFGKSTIDHTASAVVVSEMYNLCSKELNKEIAELMNDIVQQKTGSSDKKRIRERHYKVKKESIVAKISELAAIYNRYLI